MSAPEEPGRPTSFDISPCHDLVYGVDAAPAVCTVNGHTFELWPGDEVDVSTDPPTVRRAEVLQGGGQ